MLTCYFYQRDRLGISNNIFRNVPAKYAVKEEMDPVTGSWRYFIADEQINLMSAYPSWAELRGSGLNETQVRIKVITDPWIRKELMSLLKNYGSSEEFFLDNYNRLRANAYLMLDQIVHAYEP